MRSLLIRILLWSLKFLKYQFPQEALETRTAKYKVVARKLASMAEEKYPDGDEIAKRHWVVTRLQTAYPKARHRDLSITLEYIVQEMKGKE